MRTPARSVSSPSLQSSLQGLVTSLFVMAAMATAFLWAAGHDDQRNIELVLLVSLAPAMLARTSMADYLAWAGPAVLRCLGGFFVLGAVSAFTAFSLRHAVYEWSIMVLLVLVALLLAVELARAGTSGLQTILYCVVAVGALYVLRMVLMYAAAFASGLPIDMHGLAVGFSNARFLNHTQTALLPLIVLLYLRAPKGRAWHQASFALAAFWWAFLFVSEARATLLAFGTASIAVLVLRRSHARAFLKAMALTAAAGVIVYVLGFILLPVLAGLPPIGMPSNVMARTAADPTSGRTLLWKLALQLIASHPWLGVGPHHFAHEGSKLYIGAHPHDWLLQIGAEWGVPALLCLLGALGLGARSLIRSGKRIAENDLQNQQILVALLASCASIFVDGLFSGVLVMPQSQLAIVLIIGCAAGWVRSLDAATPAPAPSPVTRWYAVALAAAALCGLVWAVAPDVVRHAHGEPLTPAEQAANPSTHWPRMWEAGYF